MSVPAPAVSLRQAALRWLAQREHSRSELRERLLRHRPRPKRLQRTPGRADEQGDPASVVGDRMAARPSDDVACGSAAVDAPTPEALAEAVESVLDWLAERGYLNEARFVESRVHARMAQWGQRRIQHELQQHGLTLDGPTAATLRQSELQRAQALWQRRFAHSEGDAQDKLRQMRFLAGRGFSAEVIRRVVAGLEPLDTAE